MRRCAILSALAPLVGGSLLAGPLLGRQLAPLQAKQVNAPPADILNGVVVLPRPADLWQASKAALLPVVFDDSGRWQAELPVEGPGELSLVPLSPEAAGWALTVAEPGGPGRSLSDWIAAGRAATVEGALGSLPGAWARRVDLATEVPGSWTVTLQDRPGAAEGLLLVGSGGPARLLTRWTSWRHTADRPVGLVARGGVPGSVPGGIAFGGRLAAARATVRVGAASWTQPLADDGQHDDGAPDDGVFGLLLPPLPEGTVQVSILARGIGPDGLPFLRTAERLLAVSDPLLRLTGEVATRLTGDGRLAFDVGVTLLAPPRPVHLSAEVWSAPGAGATGTGGSAGPRPLAWISTMARPAARGRLTASLHGAWLARAGAPRELLLRRLRVQDPRTEALLDELPEVPVSVAALPATALVPAPAVDTPEMLWGLPAAIGPAAAAGPGGGPSGATAVGGALGPAPQPQRALMLVHGYCSGLVWPPSDFSGQTLSFLDPNANRSHDEFAQLIAAFGSQVDSFGVVAHSQGGPASLHLLTYYTSGLDKATGGRRIQSLGSPYLGTPLAGALAGIGQVFGVGCGPNTDLSESGAALWAAGIPSWARAEVTAYTTSFSGFWCDFTTNLLLDNPEDGVVELVLASLPGVDLQPHTVGQCHTTGMSDPAQYQDSSRNALMDAAAAR